MSKFIHTLQRAEEPNHYLIGGQVWEGWDRGDRDYVTAEVDGACLKVKVGYSSERYCWKYFRNLSDSVLFTHTGYADTLEEACCAALSFVPEHQVFEYLGQTYDCYGSPYANGDIRWRFVVDGDEVEVSGPIDFHDGGRYMWHRSWPPAENLLRTYCSTPNLEGRSHSVLEAMVAAVNAPESFKRSCAELIATLSRVER